MLTANDIQEYATAVMKDLNLAQFRDIRKHLLSQYAEAHYGPKRLPQSDHRDIRIGCGAAYRRREIAPYSRGVRYGQDANERNKLLGVPKVPIDHRVFDGRVVGVLDPIHGSSFWLT